MMALSDLRPADRSLHASHSSLASHSRHGSLASLLLAASLTACGDSGDGNASATGATGVTGVTGASATMAMPTTEGAPTTSGSGSMSGSTSEPAGTDGASGDTGGGTTTNEGPKLDVGAAESTGGGEPVEGCRKVDFLFVIDNSGSMSDEQQHLINSFPTFISTIQAELKEAQDYHIMVVDTDAYVFGGCEFICPLFFNTCPMALRRVRVRRHQAGGCARTCSAPASSIPRVTQSSRQGLQLQLAARATWTSASRTSRPRSPVRRRSAPDRPTTPRSRCRRWSRRSRPNGPSGGLQPRVLAT